MLIEKAHRARPINRKRREKVDIDFAQKSEKSENSCHVSDSRATVRVEKRFFGMLPMFRLLGFALLAAGFLKGRELTLVGAAGSSFWNAEWFAAAVVAWEIVLGCWLLSGIWPRISWWLSVLSFIAFLGISLDRALSGAVSCGCFGSVQIPPWYMVAFDGAALILLWATQPAPCADRQPKWRWVVLGASLAVSAAVILVFRNQAANLDESGDVPDGASTIVLQPDTWVGKRFPLLKHIDVGHKLEHGEWVVMLYHRTCPECQELLPQFLGLAHQFAGQYERVQAALIEVPPFEDGAPSESSSAAWLAGRLDGKRRWVGATPRFVRLKDGRVELSTKLLDQLRDGIEGAEPQEPSDGYLFPDYRRVRREMFLREIACGPLALVAVLRDSGIALSPDDVEGLLAEAGSKGIDMLRLKQLAEGHGLHALGVAVSPKELRRLNAHAIVHLNGVGFAAVTGFVPGGVRVVYPLQTPGVLPDHVFDTAFGETGFALLLSRSPLLPDKLGLAAANTSPPQGPHLQLSRRLLAVGRVHRKDWATAITVTNDGTENLRIGEVKALCSCMAAGVAKAELAPGESTELWAKGKEMNPGSFTAYVELHTNQPDMSVHKIPVRGYLEQPVGFEKPAAMFEKILPGQKVELKIGLDVPPTINPERLSIRINENGPLEAKVERPSAGQSVLSLRWAGVNKPGWYRYRIDLFDGSPETATAAPFFLAIQVVPEVVVFPPSAAVADADWERGWTRQIHCTFNRPFEGQWNAVWSDSRIAQQVRATIDSKSDGLIVRLEATAKQVAPTRGTYALRLVASDGTSLPLELIVGNVPELAVRAKSEAK